MTDLVAYRAQCKCGWDGPWDLDRRATQRDGWKHRVEEKFTHVESDVYGDAEYID